MADGEIDRILTAHYYDVGNSGSFGGVAKLHKSVKEYGITRKQVQNWLQNQTSYSVFKPTDVKFDRPRVIVSDKEYMYDADTVNMVKYKHKNRNYSYILVFIDVFTRYLYTYPLKTLKGLEMSKAFSHLLSSYKIRPQRIRTDKGSEFVAVSVQNFFLENNIKHFTTTNTEIKANFAERAIQTLKSTITRHMFHYDSDNWLDILNEATKAYNNHYHKSIRMTPKQALTADNSVLWYNQYIAGPKFFRKRNKPKDFQFKFSINDYVRLSRFKKTFGKAYDKKWTEEIFIITKREIEQQIAMYRVKDFNNENILGRFYENELEKVNLNSSTSQIKYEIDSLIKKETKGQQKGYIVSWKNLGQDQNTWVSAEYVSRAGI